MKYVAGHNLLESLIRFHAMHLDYESAHIVAFEPTQGGPGLDFVRPASGPRLRIFCRTPEHGSGT